MYGCTASCIKGVDGLAVAALGEFFGSPTGGAAAAVLYTDRNVPSEIFAKPLLQIV